MADYKGRAVSEATPSMPVEVLGLSDVPLAGDAFRWSSMSEASRLQPGVLNEGALKRSERLPRKYRLRICSARSRRARSRSSGSSSGRCAGSVEAVRKQSNSYPLMRFASCDPRRRWSYQ